MPSRPPKPPTDADRTLAAAALSKRRAGRQPSKAELAALRKLEAAREEELRWRYYRTIPQRHWREMSGRQTKVLHEQAAAYGLPLGGPVVDLPVLARALHDFLAANAQRLGPADGSDPLLSGSNSPALERYREERAKLARMDRLEREGALLSRDRVHDGLARIASVLRGTGEALERGFGAEALRILHEALDNAQREIDRLYAHEPTESDDANRGPDA